MLLPVVQARAPALFASHHGRSASIHHQQPCLRTAAPSRPWTQMHWRRPRRQKGVRTNHAHRHPTTARLTASAGKENSPSSSPSPSGSRSPSWEPTPPPPIRPRPRGEPFWLARVEVPLCELLSARRGRNPKADESLAVATSAPTPALPLQPPPLFDLERLLVNLLVGLHDAQPDHSIFGTPSLGPSPWKWAEMNEDVRRGGGNGANQRDFIW